MSHPTPTSPFALPHLAEVFEALRRGRHICPEDGRLYRALRDHQEAYIDLFYHLGFALEVHSRDFYYLQGRDNLSLQASRMAVFIFILVESLADRGEPVVDSLMTQTFYISELPHLKSARYRAYMQEAGAAGEDELLAIVRQLERFGFAQRLGHEGFRFRAPAYRFFDLCHDVLQRSQPQRDSEEAS